MYFWVVITNHVLDFGPYLLLNATTSHIYMFEGGNDLSERGGGGMDHPRRLHESMRIVAAFEYPYLNC